MDEDFYKVPSYSTAGAISIRNAKGQLVTKKVKVKLHVAGEIPEYAQKSQEDDDEDEEEFSSKNRTKTAAVAINEETDSRLRRLQARHDDKEDRFTRNRRLAEPTILEQNSDDDEQEEEEEEEEEEQNRDDDDQMEIEESSVKRVKVDLESSDDEEMDEEAIERRREQIRMRNKQREEDLLQIEDEKEPDQEEIESSEESESEEEEDEDEDEGFPRLKPVFVRKVDRRTVAEREAEEKHQIQLEIEKKRLADQRKMESQKIVEQIIREEKLKEKEAGDGIQCEFDTDDEDTEAAYDAWKLRELKRLKRDREERDQREREKQELERWHNMTDAEREAELKKNPKIIDNAAPKEKYKYLQKYYHRGAFFMDKDDEIFKRNFAAPTLEDNFDKTVLPKVMQVKNFGMAGRTKYTHLLDQDTTIRDKSQVLVDKQTMMKFHREHGGGMKPIFERPKLKKSSKKDK